MQVKMLLAILLTSVVQASYLGMPECNLDPWQPKVSVLYGWESLSIDGFSATEVDAEHVTALVEVGVISDRLSVFAGGSFGDAEVDGYGEAANLDDAWLAGLRYTIWTNGTWTVGGTSVVQQYAQDVSIQLAGKPFTTGLDVISYMSSLGVERDFGALSVYAGGYFQYLDGEQFLEWGTFRKEAEVSETDIGAYGGVSYQIGPVDLTAELQIGDGTSGFLGAGFTF